MPKITVYQTSAEGDQLTKIEKASEQAASGSITLKPEEAYQTITGIGGSFTEASAYLLNQLSADNRKAVLEAYFGDEGAKYSLTRTHINSCDFSLSNYSYAPVAGDKELVNFSIEEDTADLIPMIKEAMAISSEGFNIIASPWTAPPWMKDNKDWRGGKLLPEYYGTWARFFSKYVSAYQAEG
ncbi:MAG: glycosyl hydrolase family 30, partial [Bacteroidota bacterium]